MATGNQVQDMFAAAVRPDAAQIIADLPNDQRAEVLSILDKIKL